MALLPRNTTIHHWGLFTPPFSFPLQPNELVFLLRPRSKLEQCHRKGRIESIDRVTKKARVLLLNHHQQQYDGSLQPVVVSVPLKRLIPIYTSSSTEPVVLVTADTNQYRNLAMSQVHDQLDDDILEVGCSTGETSVLLLANHNVSWVGLDTSAEMIQLCTSTLNRKLAADHDADDETTQTRRRHHVFRVDALLHPNCAFQQATMWHEKGPTVVFIDIGGNRDCTSVLKIMAWCFHSFPRLRLAVIKSEELVRELRASAANGSLALDSSSGRIDDGDDWFHHRLALIANSMASSPSTDAMSQRRQALHPLRAPLVMSPADGRTPICRYHNYHSNGCKRMGDGCPLDHEHCHLCLSPGHTARDCTAVSR